MRISDWSSDVCSSDLAGRKAVHPNDHVNLGQSSNDVIPTTIRVGAQLAVVEDLLPALKHLRKTIDGRARAFGKVVKTGRTHLMDAMPMTFAQELGAWSSQLASAQARIEDALKRLRRRSEEHTSELQPLMRL